MRLYKEEEMLQLSGIQHYVFCPRQWALWALDQIWLDNALTMEGSMLHENVDNPFARETGAGQNLTLRGLRLGSPILGLSGIADAVEIIPFPDAPKRKKELLESRKFTALPVEYKRGKTKINDCDRLQVAAQAVILEEMWGIDVERGAVFYWQTRNREYIDITDCMREQVKKACEEMHSIIESQALPAAVKRPHCRNCSLNDYCLPSASKLSARKYLVDFIRELD